MTEAVVPYLRDSEDRRFRDLGTDMVAQLTVHGSPNIVVILEGKADAGDPRDRHESRQDER